MSGWKFKRESDLRYVFASDEDVSEAAGFLAEVLGSRDVAAFSDIVKLKMGLCLTSDVPTSRAEDFVLMLEMVRNDRADIKQHAEVQMGMPLVQVDNKLRPSIRAGRHRPFGFMLRDSDAGRHDEKARSFMALSQIEKTIRRKAERGEVTSGDARMAELAMGATRNLLGAGE